MSEQSYLASLNVLVHHFVGSALLPASLGGMAWQEQLEVVFSNVREVRQASEEFLLSVREVQAPNGVACVGVAETMLEFVSVCFGKGRRVHGCYCVFSPDEEQVWLLREVLHLSAASDKSAAGTMVSWYQGLITLMILC